MSTPKFLTDPCWQPLGSVTTNLLGQTELRTPQSHFVGSYDPRTNVTRDARGFVVSNGDLLSSLLNPGPFGL